MSQKKLKYIKEAPRYNLCTPKQNSNTPISMHICTPPFCNELPKGNHDSSSKGGGCRVEPLALAKSARKA